MISTKNLIAELNLKEPQRIELTDNSDSSQLPSGCLIELEAAGYETLTLHSSRDEEFLRQPTDLPKEYVDFVNAGVQKNVVNRLRSSLSYFELFSCSLVAYSVDDDCRKQFDPINTMFSKLIHYEDIPVPNLIKRQELPSSPGDESLVCKVSIPAGYDEEKADWLSDTLNSWLGGAPWTWIDLADSGEMEMSIDFTAMVVSMRDLLCCALCFRDYSDFMVQYASSLIELVLKVDREKAVEIDKLGKKLKKRGVSYDKLSELTRQQEARYSALAGEHAAALETIEQLKNKLAKAEKVLAEKDAAAKQEPVTTANHASCAEGRDELVGTLARELDAAGDELAKLRVANQELLAKIDSLRTEAEAAGKAAKHAVALKDKAYEVADNHKETAASCLAMLNVRDLEDLPASPAAALDLAAAAFDDTLLVTDEARESAEAFENGNASEVWQALRALATCGADLLFSEDPMGDVCKQFQDTTGFVLALREGKHVKENEDFARERRVTVNGKTYDCFAHLKGRKKRPGATLRIHFAVDRDLGKIVVAHCGDHLPCYITQKLGI